MGKKDIYDDLPLRVDLRAKKKGEPAVSLRRGGAKPKRLSNLKPSRIGPIRGVSAPATRTPEHLGFRRVVVKARVIKMTAYGVGAAKLHLRYLDREGTGQTEEREGFFDRECEGIPRQAVDAIREGEPHQFRLIVSPEDAERLDLKDYTRKLMGQVESDLGRKLDWKAINHYNTDNPHTHIVIHGLDQKGEEVFIDREYISNGIRHRAAELATQELGHRLEHEIRDSIQKEIKAKSFTRADRELIQQSQNNRITFDVAGDTPAARLQRSRLLGRLQELERFGYAEKVAGQQWRLADNLPDKLKQLGQYDEAMTLLKRAEQQLGHPASGYRLHDPASVTPLEGVVLDRGLSDEMSERGYLILGSRDGILHQVPVSNLSQEETRVGQVIRVQVLEEKSVKAADWNIAGYAAAHDGIYHAESHATWAIETGKITPTQQESYLHAHQLRLNTLSNLGVVKSIEGNRWQIPEDLPDQVQALAQKDSRTTRAVFVAQHQLPIDTQVTYRGRTWLDEHYHALVEDGRPQGVAIKLRNAAALRAQWLTGQGLEAGTQASRSALDDMERQTLAAQVRQKTGLPFRPLAAGESMQGKVLGVVDVPSNRRYAVVANSKEFSMVPWKQEPLPPKGMNMAIGINPQGRAWSKQIQKGIAR